MGERRAAITTAVGWPRNGSAQSGHPMANEQVGWPADGRSGRSRESAARIWRRSVSASVKDDVSRETPGTESTEGVEEGLANGVAPAAVPGPRPVPRPDVSPRPGAGAVPASVPAPLPGPTSESVSVSEPVEASAVVDAPEEAAPVVSEADDIAESDGSSPAASAVSRETSDEAKPADPLSVAGTTVVATDVRAAAWSVPVRQDEAVDAVPGDPSDVSRETTVTASATVAPEAVDPADPLGVGDPSPEEVSRETLADTPIAQEAARAVHVLNPSGTRQLPRPKQPRIMTIANQKGGVGKTTSTVNLAVALGLHGVRVLVIDLDPQGNASTGLGVDHQQGTPSIYDVLVDERPLDEVVVPVEVSPLLRCAPATIDLAGSEIELVSMERRESRLQAAISAYSEEIDYVLIDCPPSLGLLTINAFVAATEVLIPIQCEYYALEGLGQLLNNIELVTAHLNPRLHVSTILLTMYDGRTKLADQVAAEVRDHFGERVLRSVIPRSVRVSEAPGFGQSVITYDPGSRGALSYLDAAEELAQRGANGDV